MRYQLSRFKISHQGVAGMHRNDPAGMRRSQWPAWLGILIWATQRRREYLVKGFTMDDERLKNPPGNGHIDYFDDLLEHSRVSAEG